MRPSEPACFDLDIPTTRADVEALRAARRRAQEAAAANDAWRSWQSFVPATRRHTHEGFEPFELEPDAAGASR